MTQFVYGLPLNRKGDGLKVYILDIQGKSRKQMLKWLEEDESADKAEVFEDYIKFIEYVQNSPPDSCVIRLGKSEIPGLKAAGMVQQINSAVRIVFISDGADYALDAHEVGAYGYLLCPLNKDKFYRCLKEVI